MRVSHMIEMGRQAVTRKREVAWVGEKPAEQG